MTTYPITNSKNILHFLFMINYINVIYAANNVLSYYMHLGKYTCLQKENNNIMSVIWQRYVDIAKLEGFQSDGISVCYGDVLAMSYLFR